MYNIEIKDKPSFWATWLVLKKAHLIQYVASRIKGILNVRFRFYFTSAEILLLSFHLKNWHTKRMSEQDQFSKLIECSALHALKLVGVHDLVLLHFIFFLTRSNQRLRASS